MPNDSHQRTAEFHDLAAQAHRARRLCIMARKITRLRTNTRKRNIPITLTEGQRKPSRNPPTQPSR
jgi:hypothetical protein